MNKRKVYFISETIKDENGYIPCIAVEGETGFYRTNWNWGNDLALAESLADKMNEKLGINKEDSTNIQLQSMIKE